ncbi:chromosome partitioning protein ParB [Loigolactobacillus coryniformis]|jgi:uncharacterized protein (DUF1919 family)|uniref:Uncharacterized protein n=3 Tax=Loigolactobacillus coryniformis TaxID=1610 RepID=A0A0R1F3J9_9LACO|nr:hypothetical protein [Loigolactobacillus coryniformis]MDT3392485.1 chromosome partitioning protein ParB [Bacillota bacterium]OEH90525.1 chromosome partitioning protein ParB [Loigolactobacillus coryniformis subsp. coryniformis]RRG06691.1 MAG: chromosome partitioning protein ParB [Lactobacillus sp.]ATO43349.1 chromosome partitioning protein ParB [Loigolactobacillus coryniformis subsp. torquens DSM 20004 = KCTC 3535]ATO55073.1 chromosome partitioning protein ParB [Loigolactobacillus coryniform
MANYYDVTFNTIDGKAFIKRNVASDLPATKVWQDACEKVEADNLYIMMNDKTLVNLVRHHIVRIDMTELDTPLEKRARRQDQFFNTVNSLANIGL